MPPFARNFRRSSTIASLYVAPRKPPSGHLQSDRRKWYIGRTYKEKARSRIRTGDPFLTMEVLYRLSYPGAAAQVTDVRGPVSRATAHCPWPSNE